MVGINVHIVAIKNALSRECLCNVSTVLVYIVVAIMSSNLKIPSLKDKYAWFFAHATLSFTVYFADLAHEIVCSQQLSFYCLCCNMAL